MVKMADKLDPTDLSPDVKLSMFATLATNASMRVGLSATQNASLFRYVSVRPDDRTAWDYLEKTVLQNEMPLTTSLRFNDPFDCKPIIVNDITINDFEIFQKAAFKPPFIAMNATVVHPDGATVSDAEKLSTAIKATTQVMAERTSAARMASFSRRISSQLLWSHYANGYQGIAYHFVISNSSNSCLSRMRPVRYERQRPILTISEMINLMSPSGSGELYTKNQVFEQKSYLTKSTEWAYEEEERLVSRNDVPALFEPHELASIIVGPRFMDDAINLPRLKEIIARRERALPIFLAKLSESDYSIEVEWSKGSV
jgi:hypothetical protein